MPDAADRGQPRLVGDRQARRAAEALEVHGSREADARPRDQQAVLQKLAGDAALRRPAPSRSRHRR